MITLTSIDGHEISVNPIYVMAVEPVDEGTRMLLVGGTIRVVCEKYSEVKSRVAAWTKG